MTSNPNNHHTPDERELQACLHELLQLQGDDTSIPRRISLYCYALSQVRQETDQELWATLQYELADCLTRSQGQDRALNLEEAIRRYQAVLDVWTQDRAPEKWAQVVHDLGSALRLRVHGDRGKNLKRAIRLYDLALQIRTREARPDGWTATQICQGIAWKDLPSGDRIKNQARALRHYQAALEVWSRKANPLGWARVQHNLGNLCSQFAGGDRVTNLERAIKHYRLALKIRTRDAQPGAWAMTQVAVANVYVERIRGDRAENLERAIELYREALEVRTLETRPAEWAEAQYNLAVAYRKRIRGDRADNQEKAIQHYKLALKIHTHQAFPAKWATAKTDLGLVYYRRLSGDRAENLEYAIDLFKKALQVRERDTLPEQWATTQLCLANAYCDRVRGDRAENLEQAIEHYNLALEVRTREAFPDEWAMIQNNLGTAYWERIKGSRAQNNERATKLFNEALEVHTPDAFPVDARRAARNLGNLLFGEGRWNEAHVAYMTALKAADNLYRAAFMEAGREAEISENAALYAHDAFCLAHLGQFQKAIVRLEAGKTRTLTERMGRDAVQLKEAKPEDREAYRDLLNYLKALEAAQRTEEVGRPLASNRRSYTELAREVQETRQQVDALRQHISGYLPDFGPAPLNFPAIQKLVPDKQTALVEFCVTEKGSVVLVIRSEGEPETIWVEGFTRADLHRLLLEATPQVQSWLDRYQARGEDPGAWKAALAEIAASQGHYQVGWQVAYRLQHITPSKYPAHGSVWRAWFATIERVLAEVGLRLFVPLHKELKQHNLSHLILIPQGSLFLLPLHALSLDQNGICLLDRYEISYAPSATVLQRCQQRAERAQGQGLFAVANPTGDIAYAGNELQTIEPLFDGHKVVLWQNEATKEKALEQASGHGYAYFSCHGKYDWEKPLRSALLLSGSLARDEKGRQRVNYERALTLAEVEAELDLAQTRLITLSACETGLSEASGPRAEEYVGLPAGFLLAGAPAVVASLWAVHEISTASLMERFYVNHLRGDPNEDTEARFPLPAVEALRRAQIWLRDEMTAQEAARRCKIRIEELEDKKELVPTWLSETCETYTQMSREAPGSHPFAHPFHWAAFALSGATKDSDETGEEGYYA